MDRHEKVEAPRFSKAVHFNSNFPRRGSSTTCPGLETSTQYRKIALSVSSRGEPTSWSTWDAKSARHQARNSSQGQWAHLRHQTWNETCANGKKKRSHPFINIPCRRRRALQIRPWPTLGKYNSKCNSCNYNSRRSGATKWGHRNHRLNYSSEWLCKRSSRSQR